MVTGSKPEIKPRPQRYPVLAVSHPDGYIEVFADRNIDCKIARLPVAYSREAERQAESVMLDRLPPRYAELFWADHMRASGTTRPLFPSTLEDADYCRAFVGIPIQSTPAQGAVA